MKMRPDSVQIMTVSIAPAATKACGIKWSKATPSISPDIRLNIIWVRLWVMRSSRGRPLPSREARNSAVPYSRSKDAPFTALATHQIIPMNQFFFAVIAQYRLDIR